MSDLYLSGGYAANNPDWHLEHSTWKADQIIKMLLKHHLKPTRIAEVGCGAGGILSSLHSRLSPQPQCYGFDISPHAWRIASHRQAHGLEFKLGSPKPYEDFFDLALAIDVFEHVDDYLGFIRDLKPLAPWKIFHIPLDLSVLSVLRPFYLRMGRQQVGHIHYFTRETALASIEHVGMRIHDSFYTSVEVDLGPNGQKRLHSIRKLLFSNQPDFASRLLGGLSLLVLAE